MQKSIRIPVLISILFLFGACTTAYKAQPLPMRIPSSYANAIVVDGCTVAAEAFVDRKKAQEAFGFDVRGAGLLPVEVVFDNQGHHAFKIDAGQTFLEDEKGNLWPILNERIAYERTTRYAQTKKIFSEGAYSGFLGATAGAVIGAAIGIVSGNNVGEAVGKGAAVGAAAGATLGGVKGAGESNEARRTIINDLNSKSLENRDIHTGLAYGFLFFPAEAQSARDLRLQLTETRSGKAYVLKMPLGSGISGISSVVHVYPGSSANGSVPPAASSSASIPPAGSDISPPPSGPPMTGDQDKCRQWQMVEKHMVTRFDPSTGKYVEVPQEKWDWVEVPCTDSEAESDSQADADVGSPSPYIFSAPPSVAVIPGTYAYVVPDIDVDILFYHGSWYRPFGGHWYWSRSYDGPWGYLVPARVPHVLITLPTGYRRLAREYHHSISYAELHGNWHRWENSRHWHKDRNWRKYEH